MSDKKQIHPRLKRLEDRKTRDRFIIIFNDVVYIDGQEIPKADYKPKPGRKVINLDWGK